MYRERREWSEKRVREVNVAGMRAPRSANVGLEGEQSFGVIQ